MRRASCFLLVLILPCLAPPSRAAASDLNPYSYPYELDTAREVGLYAASGVLLGAAFLLGRDFTPPSDDEINTLQSSSAPAGGFTGLDTSARRRWSPTSAKFSNLTVAFSVSGPLLQAGGAALDDDNASPLVMYGETVGLTLGMTQLLKVLIARPRPYLYNPDPVISDELRRRADSWRSFPSGHTAMAFAAAVQMGMVEDRLHGGNSGWVWSAGLGVAALTGCLRYTAGKHHPSDILAGAVLGSLVGWLIPTLHENDPEGTGSYHPTLSFNFGF